MIQSQLLEGKDHFSLLLSISFLFFLVKGIRFALIGSFLPLGIPLGFLLLALLFHMVRGGIGFPVKLWAMFLLLWGFIRLGIQAALYFSPQVTEAHIREQLGLGGAILSLTAISLGVYVFRGSKKKGLKTKATE